MEAREHYSVVVDVRIQHWLPALRRCIEQLYAGATDVERLLEALVERARRAAHLRPVPLRVSDAQREVDPGWFHSHTHIGYVAYADRFGGTLAGVREHLDYLQELSVDYLHLMKVLRPRPEPNDGGYAIVDYGDVDPVLGTRDDLAALIGELHDRGISLCLDLVINHTAREHPWAVAARQGSPRHRRFFHVFPDRTEPDDWERTLPEVFPQMAPGNFTWDDELAGWVWTTFNTYQWDLDFSNPDVFLALLDVVLDLVNLGVDVLRLDAIAFTWKRKGTNCQNLPEVHLLAQAYRALVGMAAPGVLLKAEAIVAPEDLVAYLGVHEVLRDECHLAYHNQLMVMIWSALATGDARLATEALSALPATPPTAAWVTYLRCHDDIGWAVSDADAARVGISGAAHRRYLAEFFRGDRPGSFARGAPFSTNPAIGDERTSGTSAALTGVTAARAGEDDLDTALRRLALGYGIVLGYGGIPLVYMGDEIALADDATYLADPALAGDSRWMHRPYMDWERAARRHVAGTVEARAFAALRHMVDVRRSQPAMSTGGETFLHRYDDPAVLAWERRHPRTGRFFGVANVAGRPAQLPGDAFGWAGLGEPRVVLGAADVTWREGMIELAPYAVVWAVDARCAG